MVSRILAIETGKYLGIEKSPKYVDFVLKTIEPEYDFSLFLQAID